MPSPLANELDGAATIEWLKRAKRGEQPLSPFAFRLRDLCVASGSPPSDPIPRRLRIPSEGLLLLAADPPRCPAPRESPRSTAPGGSPAPAEAARPRCPLPDTGTYRLRRE